MRRWVVLLAAVVTLAPAGATTPAGMSGPLSAPGLIAGPAHAAAEPAQPAPPAQAAVAAPSDAAPTAVAPTDAAPTDVAPSDVAPPRAVLFLVDASDAMLAPLVDGRPRWDAVRDAVAAAAGDLPDGTLAGLRVAGPDPAVAPPGCADTRLLTPVGPLDRGGLASALAPLVPAGPSSTAEGLRAAVDDLPASSDATVVLVAARLGGCLPGETCGAARELVERGVALRVDGVAVGADPATLEELRCVVDATGGALRAVGSTAELTSALTRASLRALSPVARSTVQDVPRDGDAPVALPAGVYSELLRPGQSRRYLVDLAEGAELLVTAGAAAPPELADRVVLRLAVGEAGPVATPDGGDSVAVLLGTARQALRLRSGPAAGAAAPPAAAEGSRAVPVEVTLEQYGGGALPPVEVPVLLDLDVVDTVLVVEEAAEPVVLQAPAPPPERVVVPRDRVPAAMWGLVGALVWAVVALGIVLAVNGRRDRRRRVVPEG